MEQVICINNKFIDGYNLANIALELQMIWCYIKGANPIVDAMLFPDEIQEEPTAEDADFEIVEPKKIENE